MRCCRTNSPLRYKFSAERGVRRLRMRRYLIPSIVYLALSAVYLGLSNAPVRVHALSLAVLVVAFLVPSIWSTYLHSWRKRVIVSSIFALLAILAWDATAHLVITKAEPFSILFQSGWPYLVGVLVLVSLSFCISWAVLPPNNRLQATSALTDRKR